MPNPSHSGGGGGQNLPPFDVNRYTGTSARANNGQKLQPMCANNPPGKGPKLKTLEPPPMELRTVKIYALPK